MNQLRWIAFALALVVLFFASMAAGAFVARQRAAPTNPPVAAVSPSPSPAATQSSPAATPSPVPTPAAAASPPPTVPPTASPTTAPTATTNPTAAVDPPTAEQFATDLAAAIRAGDTTYLNARLHPQTLDRYGQRACRRQVREVAGSDVQYDVQGASGPASWSYETDGLATTIEDTWTVLVRQPGADPELRDLHFAPVDGTWRWFTDCGDPQ